MLSALTSGAIVIDMYGLSSRTTIAGSCLFSFTTYLDSNFIDTKIIDTSTAPFTLSYTAPGSSGKITISKPAPNHKLMTAWANVDFEVVVTERKIEENDYISINLGPATYDTYGR
jgi:hypothetical protein